MKNMYKICTSVEQSKKLIELGIDVSTADMFYALDANIIVAEPYMTKTEEGTLVPAYKGTIPTWSLSALLSVLPEIQGFRPTISLKYNYVSYIHRCDLYTNGDNLVDACYEMILKLNELKLLRLSTTN